MNEILVKKWNFTKKKKSNFSIVFFLGVHESLDSVLLDKIKDSRR